MQNANFIHDEKRCYMSQERSKEILYCNVTHKDYKQGNHISLQHDDSLQEELEN